MELNEHQEQVRFVTWLEARKLKFTTIPNGFFTGKPNYGQIQKLWDEGWRKGIPDMLIIVPYKGTQALVFIEMKKKALRPKRGGKGGVSEEQRAWIDALNECESVGALVAYGANDAIRIIEEIMCA